MPRVRPSSIAQGLDGGLAGRGQKRSNAWYRGGAPTVKVNEGRVARGGGRRWRRRRRVAPRYLLGRRRPLGRRPTPLAVAERRTWKIRAGRLGGETRL